MTDEPALPPLPDPIRQVVYNESKGYAFSAYTADQMRAYARAAQAQPAASGEPVAWTYTGIKADGSEHGPHLVWNPAYMDAMSASKGAQATPLYAAPQPAPAPADIAASGEPFRPDWDRIEALQESLREHMAEIHRLRAALAKPATIAEWWAAKQADSGEPWRCACGANLYIDDKGAPRSKA